MTVEPPAPPINFSFIPFNLINVRNTNDFIDIIKVRLILRTLLRVHLRVKAKFFAVLLSSISSPGCAYAVPGGHLPVYFCSWANWRP